MQKLRSPFFWLSIAGILAVYAALGFLAVPRILTGIARDTVKADFGRDLAIGDLRFNPFTLTLEVDKLALPDADGSPLLAFDRLLVDFELNSLWRRAFSFRKIALDGLAVSAVIRPGGALNLADLQTPEPGPAVAPAGAEEPLPRLIIGELSVNEGRVRFEDRNRPEPFVADIKPLTFRLTDFSTYIAEGDSYELNARLFDTGRLVWRGTLKPQPLASDGEFTLSDLPLPRLAGFFGDALRLEVTSGTANLRGRYTFANHHSGADVAVDDGELTITRLAIRDRGEQTDYLNLDQVTATGLKVSSADEKAVVGEITLTGGRIQTWLTPDGELKRSGIFDPLVTAPSDAAKSALIPVQPSATAVPGTDNATSGKGWQVSIPRISVRNLGVSLEDRALKPAPALLLQPLNLTVDGYSTAPGTTVKVGLEATVNASGKLKLAATANLDTLATEAELDLSGVQLALAQPYIEQQTSLTLTSGTFAAKGKLTYADAASKPQLGFTGDVGVTGLRTIDNVLHEDFVKWDALRMTGLQYSSAPESLRIHEIEADNPYARVIVGPDGTTNSAAILAGPGAVATAAEGPTIGPAESRNGGAVAVSNPTPAKAPAGTAVTPFPVRVGKVRMAGGSMNFADLTTRPKFAIGIGQLKGTIAGLSSDPASRAKVDLVGQVDRFSPVTIRGEVNPLAAETFLDMAMTFRNVELASFTPYAGRFAGYSIRQGKLSVDLNYKVTDRKLDAHHKFVINQFELGDKVESPDAIGLPLKLAVALLKDRNGVIDLDLPVTGDLDDPKFRIGPIVWKVLVNLLTKAITAPFALLGSLFGGGEDVNLLAFTAGVSALDDPAREKLGSLVKALTERPSLELSVPAVFNRSVDGPALVEIRLQQRVVAARKAQLAARKQPADAVAFEQIAADRAGYLREMNTLWQKEFGAGTKAPEPPPLAEGAPSPSGPELLEARIAALEAGIRQRIEITDADLFELAKARAEAAQTQLLTDTGVDPGRVFLISPAEGKASDSGVAMELVLR